MKKSVLAIAFAVSLLTGITIAVSAQNTSPPDNDDIQSWNDLQLTVKMHKRVDFYMAVTGRFGKDISRVNETRFAIGYIFKPTASFSIMPFYWYINARNAAGSFRIEHRLNLRFVYKFPLKNIGISHRSWFEYRIRSTGNSWRYRPSITIEKALPKSFGNGIKAYLTEEPFYDSKAGRFSRNRFSLGINKTINKHLSLDLYYLYQGDTVASVSSVSVIGTSWKLHF